jgi:cytochrome c biogenesis protein
VSQPPAPDQQGVAPVVESDAPPEANPAVRRPVRGPSGPFGFVRASLLMGWRWLTRMRTALYLLGALAFQTFVATIVPQEPNVPATVASWRAGEGGPGRTVSAVLDALGAYDVYGSALFLALLLLLVVSLTACMIPRVRAWVRLVRRSQPPILRHTPAPDARTDLEVDLPPQEALDRATSVLSQRRWRLRRVDAEGRTAAQVAAEKGLWSREGGSLAFHGSFYVLLLAIVLGQLLTFEGQRGLIEGERGFTDTAISYWSYSPGRWFGEDDHRGWQLELDEFHVDWVRDPMAAGAGQPTEFRSDVTVTPADGAPYQAVIDSNRPLMIEGMRVTQLDWGYAPRIVVEVDGEVVFDDFVTAIVTDGGFFRTAVKAPAADPDVGLEVFLYPFAPDDEAGRPQLFLPMPWADAPVVLFRQWRGDLQLGATQQTVNQLDTSELTSAGGAYLRPGQTVELEGVTVSFPELRRWVGFQVSSRPQLPWLLAGAMLLVLGLVTALYAYRRRLWVVVSPAADGRRTIVTVTGRAFQRPDAFEVERDEIITELREAFDAPSATTDAGHGPEPDDAAPAVAASGSDHAREGSRP